MQTEHSLAVLFENTSSLPTKEHTTENCTESETLASDIFCFADEFPPNDAPVSGNEVSNDINDSVSSDPVRAYWMKKASDFKATIEAMMLDSKAAKIERMERKQILACLPRSATPGSDWLAGKTVLELGAGIGRYTRHFAVHAHWVTAVDIVDDFIQRSRQLHAAEFNNISFVVADVRDLRFDFTAAVSHERAIIQSDAVSVYHCDSYTSQAERANDSEEDAEPKRFDLVFMNWLLMYLSNDEVDVMCQRFHDWLNDSGFVFVRESCKTSIGGLQASSSAAKYRDPEFYRDVFLRNGRFQLLSHGNVKVYERRFGNPHQYWWLFQKASPSNQQSNSE